MTVGTKSQPQPRGDAVEASIEAVRLVEQGHRSPSAAGVAEEAAVDLEQAVGVTRGREEAGVDRGDGACAQGDVQHGGAPGNHPRCQRRAESHARGIETQEPDRPRHGRYGASARSTLARIGVHPEQVHAGGDALGRPEPRGGALGHVATRQARRGENQAAQEDNGQAHGES